MNIKNFIEILQFNESSSNSKYRIAPQYKYIYIKNKVRSKE